MFILPNTYNVVLTFSPIEEITGHWFEVYEYYIYLKEYGFSPCMVFQSPNIKYDSIKETLLDKYSIFIDNDLYVLSKKELLICCPNAVVIVCDGNFKSLIDHRIKILAKKFLGFGCGNISVLLNDTYKDAIYLADKRIYTNLPNNTIHYSKKIYSKIFKDYTNNPNNSLFYLTKNCRLININILKDIIQNDFYMYDNNIIITNDESYKVLNGFYNSIVLNPPVKNLYNMFKTYVYTPIPRKFDCSSRMIAECNYYGKDVEYYIDYYDIGLEIRKNDIIENTVWLKKDDPIIKIIEEFL